MDRKMVDFIKEQYPPGTRIRLNSCLLNNSPFFHGHENSQQICKQTQNGEFFRHAQEREDLSDCGVQAAERTGQNDHFPLYFYLLQPRQDLYAQPAGAAACEVPGVGAGADGSLIRCRRSFPAFRYAPLRKTALYYHAFQILGISRLHIS